MTTKYLDGVQQVELSSTANVGINLGGSSQPLNALNQMSDGASGTFSIPAGVLIFNGSTWDRVRSVSGSGSDSVGATGLNQSAIRLFNGSQYDRQYNNTQGTLLASLARTATPSSPQQTNYNARGVIATLDVTAVGGTGGLTLRFYIIDPVTGKKSFINTAPTVVTAIGTYVYELYPTTSSSSPITQFTSGALPRTWGVDVVHSDGSSYTYSLGYALIL